MAKGKSAASAAGSEVVHLGPRSERQKMLAFIHENPAFEGLSVTDDMSDADLAAAMQDHLKQSERAQPISRSGAYLERSDGE